MPLQIDTTQQQSGKSVPRELNVLRIPIVFIPRECRKYEETVTFDINGLHKIEVKISGEGAPLKLELERTEDQNVDFGVVRVGREATRAISVVNLSKKPVTITFDTDDQLAELKKYFVGVQPSAETISIAPREKREIEISFAPKQRLHAFRRELSYKIVENQETRKLLSVQGTCHGMELKLMEDTIGFGVVTVNSKKTKMLQLSNLGDIGAKFEWDTTFCSRFFTITPQKGFLPPNEDTHFTITFHPDVVDPDIRFNKVRCNVQGADPLYINLLGKCVGQPKEAVQDLKFETVVRTPKVQKVVVKNPTAEACKIRVSVSATLPQYKEYFPGKEVLDIPPNGQADYEVTYNPKTMTTHASVPGIKEPTHEGTLFFPMPDGSALLYNLYGVSTPPAAEQVIEVPVKAKHTNVTTISIKNWLKTQQRFAVTWKLDVEDPTIFISGANTFDVAGESSKEYKISLFGLKQTTAKISVYFTNEKTFEYSLFRINLAVSAPDAQQKIEMASIVRETVAKIITIENPLNKSVEIRKDMLISDNENVSFNPNTFIIQAHSEFGFEIVYRPLLVRDETAKVVLKSPELGEFIYPLSLKGLAPTSVQRTMSFKASLGSDIIQSFKFQNYCRKPTTYTCRVDKLGPGGKPATQVPAAEAAAPQKGGKGGAGGAGGPAVQVDFVVETPTIAAPPTDSQEGSEVTINVRYEPSSLGESSAILLISSPEGGEYQCILQGYATPPQPKGPFKMAGAKPEPIVFKNPFFDAQEFVVRIDNPSFTTAVKNPVKIDGKKPQPIQIAYKAVPGTSTNGRLIISLDKGDYPPWVFYLQGE